MSYGQQPIRPPIEFHGDPLSPTYAELRLQWRIKQSDADIRALAYEYKVGRIDECTEDAWAEYEVRFGELAKGPREEFTKKARQRTPSQSRKRRPKVA